MFYCNLDPKILIIQVDLNVSYIHNYLYIYMHSQNLYLQREMILEVFLTLILLWEDFVHIYSSVNYNSPQPIHPVSDNSSYQT